MWAGRWFRSSPTFRSQNPGVASFLGLRKAAQISLHFTGLIESMGFPLGELTARDPLGPRRGRLPRSHGHVDPPTPDGGWLRAPMLWGQPPLCATSDHPQDCHTVQAQDNPNGLSGDGEKCVAGRPKSRLWSPGPGPGNGARSGGNAQQRACTWVPAPSSALAA